MSGFIFLPSRDSEHRLVSHVPTGRIGRPGLVSSHRGTRLTVRISALPNASFGLYGAFAVDAPSSWFRLRDTGEIVIGSDEFT
jgi:hypothetical protein